MTSPTFWRTVRRSLTALVLLGVVFVSTAIASGWSAFGANRFGPTTGTAASSVQRAARRAQSPQYRNGKFVNSAPLVDDMIGGVRGLFSRSATSSPTGSLPVNTIVPGAPDNAQQFRVTWYGHSSVRVEVEGLRVLLDPMWSARPSPFTWIGPERWYAPPATLPSMQPVDVVLISHDHYDHLDQRTLVEIAANPANRHTRFLVPLGVGAHLEHWGIAAERITELDWWEQVRIGDATFTCTPARHASGRTLFDRDATLWAGWAIAATAQRLYYSGDTGMMPAFREIGEKLGPFDVTLMQIGAYGDAWPDWHLTPEEAITAHAMLRGRTLLPVHWGLFNLAYHSWRDPIDRLMTAGAAQQITIATPRPGEAVTIGSALPLEPWWAGVPR